MRHNTHTSSTYNYDLVGSCEEKTRKIWHQWIVSKLYKTLPKTLTKNIKIINFWIFAVLFILVIPTTQTRLESSYQVWNPLVMTNLFGCLIYYYKFYFLDWHGISKSWSISYWQVGWSGSVWDSYTRYNCSHTPLQHSRSK